MPEFNLSVQRQHLVGVLVEKLPELRKKCRMSQEDLGVKIGKSRQTISDIERRVAPMGWDTFLAIILVLKLYKVYDDFVDGTQYNEFLRNELL